MSFDPAKYSAVKAASGIASVSLAGDAITLVYKQFDPVTGDPLANGTDSFSLAQIQQQIAYYRAAEDNLSQLVLDCSARS